jgi:hypothetical protein
VFHLVGILPTVHSSPFVSQEKRQSSYAISIVDAAWKNRKHLTYGFKHSEKYEYPENLLLIKISKLE